MALIRASRRHGNSADRTARSGRYLSAHPKSIATATCNCVTHLDDLPAEIRPAASRREARFPLWRKRHEAALPASHRAAEKQRNLFPGAGLKLAGATRPRTSTGYICF